MRRRRRRGSTAQQFLTEDLTARVNQLMDNRRRLLAPFPVDAQAVYDAGWTDVEHAALKLLLAKNAGMFREGKALGLVFRNNERDFVVRVTLPEERPMPGFSMTLALKDLPLELKEPIVRWIPQWYSLRQEQNRLLVKIGQCAKVCKTYGQLHRLWPDILSFYDDHGKQKVNDARVRSAYPENAMQYEVLDDEGNTRASLREEFLPAAFAPFTGMIAECLMLPIKESVEVAKIETGKS